ncbi:hypothetical protein [Dapis sp. BLCC M229]|uniref:hypothetical protein n=1 Tax=Dapis sp. BLCC M229 TaxID=3400188 RepID=UPI003CF91022
MVLVLADEPTATLDSKSSRNIVEIIQNLAIKENTTILLVTQDYCILKGPVRNCSDIRWPSVTEKFRYKASPFMEKKEKNFF